MAAYLIDVTVFLSVNILGEVDIDIVGVICSFLDRDFLIMKERLEINRNHLF